MLQMRPNCECCDKDLPPDSTEVLICSFECTFCQNCVTTYLNNRCPNCGGDFTARPTRASTLLEQFPAATARKHNSRLMQDQPAD